MCSSTVVTEESGARHRTERVRDVVRRYGARRLLVDAFVRFRCGDGFSHARALALLLCLAVVPLLIALTGLAEEVGMAGGRIIAYSALALTPGRSDALLRRLLLGESDGDTGEVALGLGLASGLVAVTAAMAQMERGANRLYGVRRDRPTVRKYVRGFVLALLAGVPAFCGFVLVAAGPAVAVGWERTYGWNDDLRQVWSVLRLPAAPGWPRSRGPVARPRCGRTRPRPAASWRPSCGSPGPPGRPPPGATRWSTSSSAGVRARWWWTWAGCGNPRRPWPGS